jgi:hypothetical protein
MEKIVNFIILKHTDLDAYFSTQHPEHAKWVIENATMEYDDPPKKWDTYQWLVAFYFTEPLGVSYFQFKSLEDVKRLGELLGIEINLPIALEDNLIYDVARIDDIRIALFYSTS